MHASEPESSTDAQGDDWCERAAKVLPTEHFCLQSARNATISDSVGRASMYLGALSASIVAVAFIGQASDMGTAFNVFALVLFPVLAFLGLTTVVRVSQSGAEDFLYARGISRIRRFYLDYVPEAEPYFILAAHDDAVSVLRNMGIRPARYQQLLTVAGTVVVVNSVVVGVFIGMLVALLDVSLAYPLIVGAIAFVLATVAHYRIMRASFRGGNTDIGNRFPSPGEPHL